MKSKIIKIKYSLEGLKKVNLNWEKKESANLKIGEEQNNRERKESKRNRASETRGTPLAPKIHIKGSRKREKEGPENI